MTDNTERLISKYPYHVVVPFGRVPHQHKCPSGKNFAYIPDTQRRVAQWRFETKEDLTHFLTGQAMSQLFGNLARSVFGYAWTSLIAELNVTATFGRAQAISNGEEPTADEINALCAATARRAEETATHFHLIAMVMEARRG